MSGCTVCDNCLAKKADSAARFPNDEETVAIQKALSCVARVNSRFGRGTNCAVPGRLALKVKSSTQDWTGLSTLWTVEAIWAKTHVWGAAEHFFDSDRYSAVSSGQYPTLSLTELGGDIMRKKQRIPYGLARRQSQKTALLQPYVKGRCRQTRRTMADYDITLFDALRNWRRGQGNRHGQCPCLHHLSRPHATRINGPRQAAIRRRVVGSLRHRFLPQNAAVIRQRDLGNISRAWSTIRPRFNLRASRRRSILLLVMLGSSNQSSVHGPFERFSGPFRDLLDRFGSVVKLLIAINVVVFFLQLHRQRASHFVVPGTIPRTECRGNPSWLRLAIRDVYVPAFRYLAHPVQHAFLVVLWQRGRILHRSKIFYAALLHVGYLRRGAVAGIQFAHTLPDRTVIRSTHPASEHRQSKLGRVVAFATLFPDREVTLLLFFILPINFSSARKKKYLAMITAAADVVMLLQGGSHTANLAHLGGAAFGYLYINQLGYGTTPRWLLWLQDITGRLKPRPRPTPRNMSSGVSLCANKSIRFSIRSPAKVCRA